MNKLMKTLLGVLVLMTACGKTPEDAQPAVLDNPENLTVKSLGTTEVTLQWNPVAGAETYEWKVSAAAEIVVSGAGLKYRHVTVAGLTPGTAYVFSVRAVSAQAVSGWTPLDFTTEGKAPGPDDALRCVDAPLVVEVGAGAVLGSSGLIQVFRADGTLVDQIDLADLAKVTVLSDGTMVPKERASASHTFMDVLHSGSATRKVHYTPLRLNNGQLSIRLHDGVLDFGDSYYLTMDASVAGKAVGKADMPFATKRAPSAATLSVKADGSGDFCTLQGALNYACKLGKDTPVTIEVGEGSYPGLLYLRDKNHLTVKGVSREKSVIAYPNSEVYAEGSSARCLWLVENCNELVLENLTLENTFYAADHKGQAETIYFNSGSNAHRLTVENCALISWQDTFLCKGEVWVHNSLIAGYCDYIWGYPKACLFEDCEIRSRAAGYIVQARVPSASCKGFVFLNCRLTAESGVKDGSMYLARSAGQADCYDNVTYVNCQMASVVRPEGWLGSPAPNPSAPTATAGWKEYGTTGVSTASRNAYGLRLTAAQAEPFASKAAVLGW